MFSTNAMKSNETSRINELCIRLNNLYKRMQSLKKKL